MILFKMEVDKKKVYFFNENRLHTSLFLAINKLVPEDDFTGSMLLTFPGILNPLSTGPTTWKLP